MSAPAIQWVVVARGWSVPDECERAFLPNGRVLEIWLRAPSERRHGAYGARCDDIGFFCVEGLRSADEAKAKVTARVAGPADT